MQAAINLLPWREEAHKRRAIHFLYQLLGAIVFLSLVYVGLSHWKAKMNNQWQQTSHQLSQVQQQLQQGQSQLQRLRQGYIALEKEALSTKRLQPIFQLLMTLPLQQGELTALSLDSQKLILKGRVEHQQEFEQVHQALNQANLFEQVSLAQFQPSGKEILFEFELLFPENLNEPMK